MVKPPTEILMSQLRDKSLTQQVAAAEVMEVRHYTDVAFYIVSPTEYARLTKKKSK